MDQAGIWYLGQFCRIWQNDTPLIAAEFNHWGFFILGLILHHFPIMTLKQIAQVTIIYERTSSDHFLSSTKPETFSSCLLQKLAKVNGGEQKIIREQILRFWITALAGDPGYWAGPAGEGSVRGSDPGFQTKTWQDMGKYWQPGTDDSETHVNNWQTSNFQFIGKEVQQ